MLLALLKVLRRHTVKVGGEWMHTLNDRVFRRFFGGRHLFDSVTGFLRQWPVPQSLPAARPPSYRAAALVSWQRPAQGKSIRPLARKGVA